MKLKSYAVVGVGCHVVFNAFTDSNAVEYAREYAKTMNLRSWLLYDRQGNLIYEFIES